MSTKSWEGQFDQLKDCDELILFKEKILPILDYPNEIIKSGSIEELFRCLKGIKELRHILAHGLTSERARSYDDKRKAILDARLTPIASELNESHFDIVLNSLEDCVNMLGITLVIKSKMKRNRKHRIEND